jgi:hypothetical protein
VLGLGILTWLGPPVPAQDGAGHGLVLKGAEAEEFLQTARVVDREDIPEGVTHPQRLTLSDGIRTLHASWKTISEHIPGLWRGERGDLQFDFRDSWKHEVAAYELDKLLGLGMWPPTVARRIDGRPGALQLWVEGVMSEKERLERKLTPKGPRERIRLHNQLHCARLFRQLIYDTDFRNIENTLVDSEYNIYAIDASRAFRIQHDLLAPDDLTCFSRTALERLRRLDEAVIEERMGDFLDRRQVEGLLARRDKILSLVEERLEEEGPGKTLFQ